MNENPFTHRRLTIIGNRGGTNIGGSFERAASSAGLDLQVIEPRLAMAAPMLLRRFNWYFRGRRPTWLNKFSANVVVSCLRNKAEAVVITGIVGVSARALAHLREAGIKVANYLTDDPWNPVHRAPWFLKSLPEYFAIFSPRRANLDDLRSIGCSNVNYLPFAYDPDLHFTEAPSAGERDKFFAEILFVGGADNDRIPLCRALAEAGVSFALYGDYWDRFHATRPYWKGYADVATLRKATVSAKVCLCLTRKANRDGHTMRSYEIPAMKGVILAEATEDHRQMFGVEGECALFFNNKAEMIEKTKWLVAHQDEARQMAERAHTRITNGNNTYRHRLNVVLKTCLE